MKVGLVDWWTLLKADVLENGPLFPFFLLLSFISSFLPFPLSFLSSLSSFPHSLFLPDWETRTSVSADLFSKTLQLIQRKIFWSPALRKGVAAGGISLVPGSLGWVERARRWYPHWLAYGLHKLSCYRSSASLLMIPSIHPSLQSSWFTSSRIHSSPCQNEEGWCCGLNCAPHLNS